MSFDRRLVRARYRRFDRPRPDARRGRPDHRPTNANRLSRSLGDIRQEIEQGRFQFEIELEDIHMHIERALIDRLGDVGRKLHTARSRNDQVSTDLRLWVRDAIDRIDEPIGRPCSERSSAAATTTTDVILPAYTHMQRAQPVLAAHYWLCYCEKLQRDRGRLADCRRAGQRVSLGRGGRGRHQPADRSPGRGRAAGLRRAWRPTASTFRAIATSSLEFAFVLTMIAEHLSTWAEEWILWSTSEFDFLKLPQAFCTGSSIMPQKINPDVLELIRGKTARVVGNLHVAVGARQGPAAGLQPRFARRQSSGCSIRSTRWTAAWNWLRRWWPAPN